MTLTKNTIIVSVQNKLKIQRNQAAEVIESLLEIMKRTMENGEDVLESGFGKFCVKEKKQRKGRNPATGDDMMLPARRVVVFNCSDMLRDKINKKR